MRSLGCPASALLSTAIRPCVGPWVFFPNPLACSCCTRTRAVGFIEVDVRKKKKEDNHDIESHEHQ
jgi:hypothetical protein